MVHAGVHTGGEAGIRTLGGVTPTTVFETVPFNRSGTSPLECRRLGLQHPPAFVKAHPYLWTGCGTLAQIRTTHKNVQER